MNCINRWKCISSLSRGQPWMLSNGILVGLAVIVENLFILVDISQRNEHQMWSAVGLNQLCLTIGCLSAVVYKASETRGRFGGVDTPRLVLPIKVIHITPAPTRAYDTS